MLHMSSGVMTLVVAAITAYIKHNTTQTVLVSKVKDLSTVTTPNKRALDVSVVFFRDSSLNWTGFVILNIQYYISFVMDISFEFRGQPQLFSASKHKN